MVKITLSALSEQYDEKNFKIVLQNYCWQKLVSGKIITQNDFFDNTILNKKSFLKHRSSYVGGQVAEPLIADLFSYWLALDEVERIIRTAFPIVHTNRSKRFSESTSKYKNRLKRLDSVEECIRRLVLTLLGWNSHGVKTMTLWSIPHSESNKILLQNTKDFILGLSFPRWLKNVRMTPLSIAFYNSLQRLDAQDLFISGKSISSLKEINGKKNTWALQNVLAFIVNIANRILSGFDLELTEWYLTKDVRTVGGAIPEWLTEFTARLNIVLSQVERLLFFKEGVLRRIVPETIAGFNRSAIDYKSIYPEIFREESMVRKMPDETFENWKF